MAESQQIGSVEVEVRANLGPLQADFDRGKNAAEQFSARTAATLNTATTAVKSFEQRTAATNTVVAKNFQQMSASVSGSVNRATEEVRRFSTVWGAQTAQAAAGFNLIWGSKIPESMRAVERGTAVGATAIAGLSASAERSRAAGGTFSLIWGSTVPKAVDKSRDSLAGLRAVGDQAAQSAALITGPLGGVASRISILSSVMSGANLALLAGSAAFAGIGFGIKSAVVEAERFNALGRKTEAVIKATGAAAGLTADDIRALADELDNTTLVDVAEVEQASQMLLTFRSVTGDTFKEAIRLSADLSEVGFGSVSSSAVQMGKALEDPVQGIAALRRVGVSFTATQKEQIKNFQESGRLLEAQKVILKAVRDQVGGAAAGSAGGLTGAVDDLGDAWSRLLRSLGNTGPFAGAAAGISNLVAAALNGIRELNEGSTQTERFTRISEDLAKARAQNADPAFIAYLERERNALGELIQQTESLDMIERQRAAEKSKAVQDGLDAERKAEAEKALAPARLAAQQSAIDDELSLIRSRNDIADSENELAYARGERSMAEYYDRRRQITEAGINAEIAALRKNLALTESTPAADAEGEIARGAEVARIKSEITAKENELTAARNNSAAALASETASARDAVATARQQTAITEQLTATYNGTAASLREMAIQEKILNALASEGIDLSDAKRQALADEIRKNEELRNALQDRIDLENSLQSTRDEITRMRNEDIASTMPRAAGAAFLKEQELIAEAQRNGGTLTQEQTREIESLAQAYGQATAATEAFRAAQAAQQQFAQAAVDATSNLVSGLVTDIDNWRDHLVNFFADILKQYIAMLGQMAIANATAGGGGGGGFNWGSLISSLLGAAISGAAGGAGGGGSIVGASGNVYNTGFDPSGLTIGGGYRGHKGMVAGLSGEPMNINPAAFIDAPRYHAGIANVGRMGLRPDEVPAILQTGETVLPRGARMRGGVTNVWNITTNDSNSFDRSQRQIQRKSKFALGIQGRA